MAKIQGDSGTVRLRAALAGIRIPGPRPDLLAAAPVQVMAEVRLDQPDRPIHFSLAHPLITAEGDAATAGRLHGNLKVDLANLAPVAALAGLDLQGHAVLDLTAAIEDRTTRLDANGTVGITGGMAPAPALIGDAAHLVVSAAATGSNVTVSRLEIDGRKIKASACGQCGRRQAGVRLETRSARSDECATDLGRRGRGTRPGERTDRRSRRHSGPLGNARAGRQARGPDQRDGAITRPPRQTCRPHHRARRSGGLSARIGARRNPRRRRRAEGRDRARRLEERSCPRDACPGQPVRASRWDSSICG